MLVLTLFFLFCSVALQAQSPQGKEKVSSGEKAPSSTLFDVSLSQEAAHGSSQPVKSEDRQAALLKLRTVLSTIAEAPANGIEKTNSAIRQAAETLTPYMSDSAEAAAQGLTVTAIPVKTAQGALAAFIAKLPPEVQASLGKAALDGLDWLREAEDLKGVEMASRSADKLLATAEVLKALQNYYDPESQDYSNGQKLAGTAVKTAVGLVAPAQAKIMLSLIEVAEAAMRAADIAEEDIKRVEDLALQTALGGSVGSTDPNRVVAGAVDMATGTSQAFAQYLGKFLVSEQGQDVLNKRRRKVRTPPRQEVARLPTQLIVS